MSIEDKKIVFRVKNVRCQFEAVIQVLPRRVGLAR